MALFVSKFDKLMKKKGYGTRKRRDNYKNKDQVRRCYKFKSKDHVVADYLYNSDNDEDEKKKDKKKKKEKKMAFQKKKKGGGYVVTWESTSKHRHQQQVHHLRHSIDMPHGKAYQGKI